MKFILIIFYSLFGGTFCFLRKIVPLIDDKIENCASLEEDAEIWDTSEFDIIAESDTEVFFNGSATFLKKVGENLPLRAYAEKLQRDGKWAIEAIDLKRPDFCASLHDPKEIWYAKTNKYKCPLEAGDVWTFDHILLSLPFIIPPTYLGRWRMTQIVEFNIDGKKKMSCIRMYADIVEL